MIRRAHGPGRWTLRCSLAFAVVFVADVGSTGALNDVCRLYGPCPPARAALPGASSPAPAPLRIELVDREPNLTAVPGATPEDVLNGRSPAIVRPRDPAVSPETASVARRDSSRSRRDLGARAGEFVLI